MWTELRIPRNYISRLGNIKFNMDSAFIFIKAYQNLNRHINNRCIAVKYFLYG